MTSDKIPPPSDLSALAAEALDLWQEHLAMAATDPTAKAEMMKLMEPSRRLFADWAAMMQNGAYATPSSTAPSAKPATAATAHRAEAAQPPSDDGALRLAQLAHRVAELEKRLEKLESGGRGKAAKDSGASAKSKSGV